MTANRKATKSTSKRPISDDKYRQIVSKNATAILNSLFESIPPHINDLKALHILVIGPGMFPSFLPLVNTLQDLAPGLEKINVTLVDPLKSETQRFDNFISQQEMSRLNVEIEYSIYNMDISEYLKSENKKHYDIIYFEQPDLSPINILLAKSGSYMAKLNLSLRESLPFLKNIVRSKTIIIASCLYKRDLKQLNILINLTLKIPTKMLHLSMFKSNGAPYSCGLIGVIDPIKLPMDNSHKTLSAIRIHDTSYIFFILISLILFIITPPAGKALSFFCTVILIIYHRYKWHDYIFKAAIILTQISILLGELYIRTLSSMH